MANKNHKMVQTELNFEIHKVENTIENQNLLDANVSIFKSQCVQIYNTLKKGETLTVRDAMIQLGVGDLRARIRDLRDGGIKILDRKKKGERHKTYYMVEI